MHRILFINLVLVKINFKLRLLLIQHYLNNFHNILDLLLLMVIPIKVNAPFKQNF